MVDLTEQTVISEFYPQSDHNAQIIVERRLTQDFDTNPQVTTVLDADDRVLYRLTGFGPPTDAMEGSGCPSCDDCTVDECLLAAFDSVPVQPYERKWEDGKLCLNFALVDRTELETLIDSLRDIGYDVELRQLSRIIEESGRRSGVWLDLETLTPRQREALELAVGRKYFSSDSPGAETLAAELDISSSTFSEHVRIGLDKLFTQVESLE